ncbi:MULTISPECIES: circadian clock KaiB family protein [Hymenobacter]|uniref:Circadian clock protein KaiB n=1 Tax=Hymenobacter mucosus TaxID=1411120 RepID=A0A238V520_9BACT|nr:MULTISPECIES: circadian clock KaiB family protein [Hymenobacter]SNR29346.1 circadian clock protein KaiB [Hymenobacter mucosus]
MESELHEEAPRAEYLLHLYITGATPNSTRAVRNLKDICEQYLKGRYELLIVDIYQQPEKAKEERIIAAPTLVKKRPGLTRWLVGDLSDRRRVLTLLGISPEPTDM